tara:strand:+ start:1146 stop:1406 length:261 start_codon:yes stop_codon:yes gene_type:complete
MIAFNEDYAPEASHKFSKEKYLELLKAVFNTDPFVIGSYHGGLSPQYLGEILASLIYKDNYKEVTVTIEKEADGYHLGLTIDQKSK